MQQKEKIGYDFSGQYPKTFAYVIERDTGDVRCNRCGSVCLKSDVEGYAYQCMFCDEDLFKIETHKGDWHTTEELYEILCQARDLLCLDEQGR